VNSARFRVMLPAVWAGLLLTVALIAAPAPFATLTTQDAGRVVNRVFAQEAYVSLAFAAVLYALERRVARSDAAAGRGSVLSGNLLLIFGALFCTVAGYFALLPMMEAARAGHPGPSFGTLHAASTGLFALKTALIVGLAWRSTLAGPPQER
jgi:hypothetical protein